MVSKPCRRGMQRCKPKQQRSQLTQQSAAAAQHAAAKHRRPAHLPGNKAEQHQQRSEHNASAAEPEGSDPEELQAGEVFPGEGMHFPHATPTARALQLVHFCFFSVFLMKRDTLPRLLTKPHHQTCSMCTAEVLKRLLVPVPQP